MIKPRDSITIFADAMETKLQRDDTTKPAWETEAITELRDSLVGEFIELDHAMRDYFTDTDHISGTALMHECCDVANYAMMIFSQLNPLTRHNRRGIPGHAIPRTGPKG